VYRPNIQETDVMILDNVKIHYAIIFKPLLEKPKKTTHSFINCVNAYKVAISMLLKEKAEKLSFFRVHRGYARKVFQRIAQVHMPKV
jgi:hypothetical protein